MEYVFALMSLFVGVVIGVVIGIFIGTDRMRKAIETMSAGNLRIDRSIPDEPPSPYLEVDSSNIENIAQQKYIMLKVVNESYLSHD